VSRSRELALTGALLCAGAAILGVPALYVPGIAGLLATAVARLWVEISARAGRPELTCGSLSAEEDDRVEVRVALRRPAMPFPGGTLRPWPGGEESPLPAGRRALEVRAWAVIGRRGRHDVGPAAVRVSDPFGLCVRERRSAAVELLVLPRIHRLDAAALAFLDGVGRSSPDAPQALDSLRAHRPGSPASRIHWPTVARSGELVEHSLRPEDDARVLVRVDAARADSDEALDRAVRAAASLCFHLARRGGCLVALGEDPSPTLLGADLRSWPRLHARLALLAAGSALRPMRSPRRGISVIHVTAAADGDPATAGPHLRLGPVPVEGIPTIFELAGCAAQFLDGRSARRAA
jgi:uncharacterized protein (DUF58 family)